MRGVSSALLFFIFPCYLFLISGIEGRKCPLTLFLSLYYKKVFLVGVQAIEAVYGVKQGNVFFANNLVANEAVKVINLILEL